MTGVMVPAAISSANSRAGPHHDVSALELGLDLILDGPRRMRADET